MVQVYWDVWTSMKARMAASSNVFECLIGVCADKQDLCRHVRLGGEAYRGVGCVKVIFNGGELRD